MRLNNSNLQDINIERVFVFTQWLLDIENGNIGTPDDFDPKNCSWVDIPEHYCIPDGGNGISNLINFIYDNEMLHYPSTVKLQDKAIVCPKNNTTDIINNIIQFIKLEEVLGEDFPEHYFNFASYNKLAARADVRNAILKAIINDETATMSLTCFSDNTNTLIKDCDDILAELSNKDQYKLPSALKDLKGITYVFQFHFDSGSSSKRRDLVLDRVFKSTLLPLPAPPPHVILLEPIIKEQPRASQAPKPIATPISEHQLEAIQYTKPLSFALSTPASNQPEVVEPETAGTKEPQSTPSTTPEIVKPIKGDQQTNLPKTSARKSLFKTKPEADTSKGTKRQNTTNESPST
uniref:DNA helicase n=1 Tax=Tanacetum cinerariifolium TaxID=118510 RepID=A0A6L2J1E5_TANCI|nr:DNA helicase [Tanacetum cinerariifolium]